MANLYGELDLTKIPKELIRSVTFKDGSVHKLLSIDINELKHPSDYGHTHYISVYNKETREKTYLGDFKPSNRQPRQDSLTPQPDDMPF